MPIKIAGAGISGISAAISLAKFGYEVEIHEQAKTNASRFHGDYQGLINWQVDKDILEFLKEINIEINFPYKIFDETTIYNNKLKSFVFKFEKPAFYLVKRGPFPGAIDEAIRKQAESLGVKFHFNSKIDDADIFATGPKRTDALDIGYLFETDLPDMIVALLDDKIAPKMYAYLVVVNGEATCATVMMPPFKNSKVLADIAFETFCKLYNLSPKNKRLFSGYGNFSYELINNMDKPYVGESAGFQDALFGAGMHYAFYSGYLAAKSIHEKLDYWELVRKEIHPWMRASLSNRFGFELLGNKGYSFVLNQACKGKNLSKSLQKRYNENKITKLLYPVARRVLKNRYQP